MPDLKAFDAMVKEHVAPLLKDAGFRKKGRTFRSVADNGDQTFVHLQTWNTAAGAHTDFFVNLSVVPVPQMEWLRHRHPQAVDRQPVPGDGLWQGRVDAPKEVAASDEPYLADLWRLADADSTTTCGDVLATVLREHAIPLLNRLTDRAEFLAMVQNPDNPLGPDLGPADILLLADEGPSPALDAVIASYDAMDPREAPIGRELAAWARERSTRHLSRG